MEFNHNQENSFLWGADGGGPLDGAPPGGVRALQRKGMRVLAGWKGRGAFAEYQRLSQGLKEEFLHFCMGVNGMRITYDPMFKFVFDPGTKPERLEEFISLCLGEEVKDSPGDPNGSGRLTEAGLCW